MNSFIPWVGGKSQLRNTIINMFPKEFFNMYIEVFGGAGWVLFAKEKHAQVEVFNDIDGNLVNLYRCIQYHCNELQRELRLGAEHLPLNSREIFQDYLEQMSARGLTDIQRAARYFYIIRISYGAGKETFGCTKKALSTAIDRLPEIEERLRSVVIENQDFERILKTYNKPASLFYIDPPYFKAEKYYQGFGPEDHDRLFHCVEALKGRFILSYNDTEEVRNMYKSYNICADERANSLASKTGKGAALYKELIITNY